MTNSELGTFRRCAREHHYAYRLGYRPRERDDDALNFGSLMHAALEAWWRAHVEAPRERLDAAFAAVDVHVDKDDGDTSIVRARAEALMVGYESRWGGVESFDVLGLELEFRAPLVNPITGGVSRTFELAGKLDALVLNHADQGVYIVEHKTSADDISPGAVYWQRLRLDAQISTYFAGARSLGYIPRGCLYDVLGKPKLQPFKATPLDSRKYTKTGTLYANQREADETVDDYYDRVLAAIMAEPERYYQRGPVVRLPNEESDAAFDAWQTARAIRDAELANCAPRNVASCERYHRLCSYFDVCTSSASLNDTARFELVDNVHPELSLATVSTEV